MVKSHKQIQRNNVKGTYGYSRESSFGRESHELQVAPERHQATDGNKKLGVIRTGPWNVRTMIQKCKHINLKREMERLNVDILGLCETRWKGTGQFVTDKHKVIFSGGEKHKKGVVMMINPRTANAIKGYWAISVRILMVKFCSKNVGKNIIQVYAPTIDSNDEEIETFYNEIEKVIKQCKSQDNTVIL